MIIRLLGEDLEKEGLHMPVLFLEKSARAN